MKTMKKVLSLVLALVMTAAIAVVPTFAAGADDNYWSSKFSAGGRAAYQQVVRAIENGQSQVAVASKPAEFKQFADVLSWEHPELFYAHDFGSSTHTQGGRSTTTIHWNLDSNYASEKQAVEQAASKFLANAPKSGSDYDKELYVHDKLANETTYELGNKNIYNSLVQKKGNCMGFSYAMKYLLNKLGVKCRVVVGKSQNPASGVPENHMWNVVTLNGKEYLTDTTWDATTKISKTLPHYYFNLTKDEMDATHTPDRPSEQNACTNSDQNYYKKNGMYYKSVSDAEAAIKKNLKKGKEMSVMLPSQKDGEKVHDDFMNHKIISGSGSYGANDVINGVVVVRLN